MTHRGLDAVFRWLVVFASLLAACDGAAEIDAGAIDAGRDAGPPPDDSPYKGPWAQRPTTDAVTVRWESRLAPDPVAIDVQPEAGGASQTYTGTARETVTMLSYGIDVFSIDAPDVPGTYYVNEVDVTGLDPATCYRYTIAGYPEEGGRFCTMHAPDDHATPIRFYAMGDTSPVSMGTLRLIAAARPEQNTEFTVHVGDIQYYSTIFESQQVWFGLMEPLLRASAFLPCIGNHEVDEIPHEYADIYQRLFTPAGRDGNDRWYSYQTGGVYFFSLSSEHGLAIGSEQLAWLEATIAAAEADPNYRFSILYLHRPLYTLGDFTPREDQRAALFPLIASRRIPLVLSGHVHAYERFEYDTVTYVTTGAGGFRDPSVDQHVADRPDDALHRVASSTLLESMIFEITEDATGNDVIRGRAIGDDGTEIDSFERIVPP